MQSWGTDSRFGVRDTRREPSKSGVIGLVAAALGIRRDDDARLARLAPMRLGVRVDHVGTVGRDYQTAGGGEVPGRKHYGVIKASGSKGETVLSTRYYLADAEFLVGLGSGDGALLREIDLALEAPVWPPYLGRRAFAGTPPLRLGIVAEDLEDALRLQPWVSRGERDQLPQEGLRLLLESNDPTGQARYDSPVSFCSENRQYRLRYLTEAWVTHDQVLTEVAHVPLPVSA
jgi:CRISPR system Cascade subunit CasD